MNFVMLRGGKTNKPVLLKRGLSAPGRMADVGEYILNENENVILCERGINFRNL